MQAHRRVRISGLGHRYATGVQATVSEPASSAGATSGSVAGHQLRSEGRNSPPVCCCTGARTAAPPLTVHAMPLSRTSRAVASALMRQKGSRRSISGKREARAVRLGYKMPPPVQADFRVHGARIHPENGRGKETHGAN